MFDELLREIRQLDGARVSVDIPPDEDGYADRACPNEECQFEFKVYDEDWRSKVRDEVAFCPFCGHNAEANEWATKEQVEYARKVALSQVESRIHSAIKHDADQWNRQQPRNSFIRITMHVDNRPLSVLLPAVAAEPMRLKIACPVCDCHYAVVGAAFFCPACGHNAAEQVFTQSLTGIRATMAAIPMVRSSISDRDSAETTVRLLIESGLQNAVTAFQRYAEALYEKLPSQSPARRNAFQNLGEGSTLWQAVTGKGYQDYLTPLELEKLEQYFQQRHLLAHRQGIIDATYIAKSNDKNYTVGQRLIIREKAVLECLDIIETLTAGLTSTGRRT